jgi:hypothetical protein
MTSVTFKDKYSGNLLKVSLPIDIVSMRKDSNWVEVLEDGTELDRNKEQREDWEIPFQSIETQPTRATKRGRK